MAEAAIPANITAANNITYGAKAGTPESAFIAFGSLILVTVLPIIIGSFQSANLFKKPVCIFQVIHSTFINIFSNKTFKIYL